MQSRCAQTSLCIFGAPEDRLPCRSDTLPLPSIRQGPMPPGQSPISSSSALACLIRLFSFWRSSRADRDSGILNSIAWLAKGTVPEKRGSDVAQRQCNNQSRVSQSYIDSRPQKLIICPVPGDNAPRYEPHGQAGRAERYGARRAQRTSHLWTTHEVGAAVPLVQATRI